VLTRHKAPRSGRPSPTWLTKCVYSMLHGSGLATPPC
jgi:hypothetical protein